MVCSGKQKGSTGKTAAEWLQGKESGPVGRGRKDGNESGKLQVLVEDVQRCFILRFNKCVELEVVNTQFFVVVFYLFFQQGKRIYRIFILRFFVVAYNSNGILLNGRKTQANHVVDNQGCHGAKKQASQNVTKNHHSQTVQTQRCTNGSKNTEKVG